MKKILIGMAAVAILSIETAPASANLITNGSFETPNITASNFYGTYENNSTGITGWTVIGDVQLVPDTFLGLAASDGHQWVDLTGQFGFGKGLKSDTVLSLELGATYQLSFDVGDYSDYGTAAINVSVNGATSAPVYTNVYQTGTMDWETMVFSWVADSNSAYFTFLGDGSGKDGVIGLDNVDFVKTNPSTTNPVPEPATMLLFGTGLAGLAAVGRRKKNV